MATQHSDLTTERWAQMGLDRQILSIAAEMYRGSLRLSKRDDAEVRLVYERVLNLVDLTLSVAQGRGLLRELCRWREVVAGLFVGSDLDQNAHDAALAVLLTFTPAAFEQRPYLTPWAPSGRPA